MASHTVGPLLVTSAPLTDSQATRLAQSATWDMDVLAIGSHTIGPILISSRPLREWEPATLKRATAWTQDMDLAPDRGDQQLTDAPLWRKSQIVGRR